MKEGFVIVLFSWEACLVKRGTYPPKPTCSILLYYKLRQVNFSVGKHLSTFLSSWACFIKRGTCPPKPWRRGIKGEGVFLSPKLSSLFPVLIHTPGSRIPSGCVIPQLYGYRWRRLKPATTSLSPFHQNILQLIDIYVFLM